jgi:hypothetical protein
MVAGYGCRSSLLSQPFELSFATASPILPENISSSSMSSGSLVVEYFLFRSGGLPVNVEMTLSKL